MIGSGASGKVYRIDIPNNETVAVKHLWTSTKMDKDDIYMEKNKNVFFNNNNENIYRDHDHRLAKAEVETLGTIRHKNIVKLYCYLSNSHSNLLVYEYMPNGNLFEDLHSHNDLDWPSRHRIALGAAHGLAYLHHDCSPAIIHRDVKSSNILLDQFYEAKIADFGVAKVLQACNIGGDSTIVFAGTHGYIAPGKFLYYFFFHMYSIFLLDVYRQSFLLSTGVFFKQVLQSLIFKFLSMHFVDIFYKRMKPEWCHVIYFLEYAYFLKVTEKSDVYSFGVVLLELITSTQPIEP